MSSTKPSQLAVRAAYVAAVLFVIRLPTFFVPAIRDALPGNSPVLSELNALLGIAPHLVLFPVVAALPAPRWGRAAGYGWLVIDMATDVMDLGGVAKLTYLSLRYGGHISAALWIASASWDAKGALRIVGWLLAFDLAIYSFIAPFGSLTFLVLLPSLVLLPLWLALVGRYLARGSENEQVRERQVIT